MNPSLLRPIAVGLITLLLASCAQTPSSPTETPSPVIEIASFPSTFEIDDIRIEFSGYRFEDDSFIIDVCFTPPSEEVWLFNDATLKIDDQEITSQWVTTKSEDSARVFL